MTAFHRLVRAALAAALLALAAALSPAGAAPLRAPQPLDPQAKLCARPIAAEEHARRIPGQLLAAVAVAESGRWRGPDRAIFAWPWTVTSGPNNWFFADKDAAVAFVKRLRKRGIHNIDVGCMQINLAYHPHAFASLEQAFDPAANVAYAAGMLDRLFHARRSWSLAVGLYHSSTPALQNHYRRKVMALWNAERRRAAEIHRRDVIARFEARRRARLEALAAPQREELADNIAR